MLREEMKLFAAFPGSVIREDGTFAVLGDPDCGLDLTVCETQEDISVHLLENLSKSACRVRTYDVPDGQEPRRVRLLRGMNQYLGTSLSEEDMTNVYRKIGNSIHPDLSRSFVEANCDMSVLIPEGSQTDNTLPGRKVMETKTVYPEGGHEGEPLAEVRRLESDEIVISPLSAALAKDGLAQGAILKAVMEALSDVKTHMTPDRSRGAEINIWPIWSMEKNSLRAPRTLEEAARQMGFEEEAEGNAEEAGADQMRAFEEAQTALREEPVTAPAGERMKTVPEQEEEPVTEGTADPAEEQETETEPASLSDAPDPAETEEPEEMEQSSAAAEPVTDQAERVPDEDAPSSDEQTESRHEEAGPASIQEEKDASGLPDRAVVAADLQPDEPNGEADDGNEQVEAQAEADLKAIGESVNPHSFCGYLYRHCLNQPGKSRHFAMLVLTDPDFPKDTDQYTEARQYLEHSGASNGCLKLFAACWKEYKLDSYRHHEDAASV